MRVAVVTAGASGLGKAVVEALAASGVAVVATTRQRQPARQLWSKSLQQRLGIPVRLMQWDPTDAKASYRLVDQIVDDFGQLDILVNNAGPYTRELLTVADTSDAVWDQMLEGNLTAAFRLIRAVLPTMRRQAFGRIVNMGFVGAGAAHGWAHRGAYVAAKAGLAALTRTVAIEERDHGVTCNMICPSDIKGSDKERTLKAAQSTRVSPVGGDVAYLLGMLIREEARFVNGQILELSFGSGWGYPPGHTSIPLVTSMLPLGTLVEVPAWGESGTIRNQKVERGQVLYEVITGTHQAWVSAEEVGRPQNRGVD